MIEQITNIILSAYPNLESIWLYGSRSTVKRFGFMTKQPIHDSSDYDVCVKMPESMKGIKRQDNDLNALLTKECGVEVNVIFCTMQNEWMEQLIFKQQ